MLRFALGLVVSFYCNLQGSPPVLDNLKTIPIADKQDMRDLFHQIFLEQDGAYTIFGDKPVAFAIGFLTPKWEAILERYPGRVLGKSWNVWQKYKYKFPLKKYLIVSETLPLKKSGSRAMCVYVINKEKFTEVVNNHLSLFESVLHTKIDPKKILDEIASEKRSFLTVINHNEILLGILLGYGKQNSILYQKSKSFRPILCFGKIKLESLNKVFTL